MFPKYAVKIRKSDIDLLTILNNGVAPAIEKGVNYLIVDTDPSAPNQMVKERDLLDTYEIAANSPLILRLKKPQY